MEMEASLADSKLTPELLVTQKTTRDAQISPDGARVAYSVGEASKEGEHPKGSIWLVSFEGGDARQFTHGSGLDKTPRWSPNGSKLAFLSDRDEAGKLALYTMRTDGGEATKVDAPKGEASEPRWSPDGRYLAFLLKDPETEEEKKRKEERDDVNVVHGNLKYNWVCVLDIESGKVSYTTPEKRHATGYDWSPDGTQLAVLLTPTPLVDDEFVGASLEIFPREGGESRKLAQLEGPAEQVRWSPDGSRIAYLGMAQRSATSGSVYVLPVEEGEPRDLTEGYEGTAAELSWSPDGSLLFPAFEDVYGALNRLSLNGEITPLLPPEWRGKGSLTPPVSWSADGSRFATIRTSGNEIEDVWGGELGGELRRLTHSNPDLEAIVGARMERVCWTASDGLEIRGMLIYPAGYQEGTRYPLVVQPHGGPAWLWSDRMHADWHDWGQWLAANGYAVLLPNVRGSTGRGSAFTAANYDDIGGGEFTDIMSGVDRVIEMGVADPERLGIGGWSWGGYLSAWAITQTDRFKAGIVGAGVTDLYSDQGQNDIPHYNDYLLRPNIYEEPLDSLQRSALYHVTKVTCPVLILHGEADERVTVAQGRELYGALRYLGKEVEMATYPREGHPIEERKHQLDLIRRVLAWYDRYLKA